MTHVLPPQQFPIVDLRSGLLTKAWREYFAAMTPLPEAEVTYDPPNLIASATTTTAVTVPGAELGWLAAAAFSLDLQGLVMTAYVSAADTVTVVLFNPTAGAINLTSGTLSVSVRQP